MAFRLSDEAGNEDLLAYTLFLKANNGEQKQPVASGFHFSLEEDIV